MKTKLLILLLILSAVLLTASTAPREQVLTGTLQWTRASTCGYQDYVYARSVSSTSVDEIFLTGNGFPTRGENAGCSIRAEGYYLRTGMEDYCRVFYVIRSSVACSVASLSH